MNQLSHRGIVSTSICLFIAGLLVGGGITYVVQELSVKKLENNFEKLKTSYALSDAENRAKQIQMLDKAKQRSDDLTIKLEATEKDLQSLTEKKRNAVTQFTRGVPCFNAATVSVLNSEQANNHASSHLSNTSSESTSIDATNVATDTDVALWAIAAKEQYAVCAARLNSLVEWHVQTKKSESHHD